MRSESWTFIWQPNVSIAKVFGQLTDPAFLPRSADLSLSPFRFRQSPSEATKDGQMSLYPTQKSWLS